MAERPLVYEFPAWRPAGGHDEWPVVVESVLSYLAKHIGKVPEALEDERAVSAFAAACSFPIADADIEDSVPFPHIRFASRAYCREQYAKFYEWCQQTGWLEAPKKKAKKKAEPAVV